MATEHSGRLAAISRRLGQSVGPHTTGLHSSPWAVRAAAEAEEEALRRAMSQTRHWHDYLILAPLWLALLTRTRNGTGLRRRWLRWTLVDSVHTTFAGGVPLIEHGHRRYVPLGYFWTLTAANRRAARMRRAGLDD